MSYSTLVDRKLHIEHITGMKWCDDWTNKVAKATTATKHNIYVGCNYALVELTYDNKEIDLCEVALELKDIIVFEKAFYASWGERNCNVEWRWGNLFLSSDVTDLLYTIEDGLERASVIVRSDRTEYADKAHIKKLAKAEQVRRQKLIEEQIKEKEEQIKEMQEKLGEEQFKLNQLRSEKVEFDIDYAVNPL